MKEFIETNLQEGRFDTSREYIRSLTRDDQDVASNKELALLLRPLYPGQYAGSRGGTLVETASRRGK
jgi:Arc/MetJ-type ribon-helix-helix transcriptional regulator